MRAPVLQFVIMIHGNSHHFATHNPVSLNFCAFGVHVSPYFFCALVMDLEFFLRYLISDKEKSVLDVLAVLPRAHPVILSQHYCK